MFINDFPPPIYFTLIQRYNQYSVIFFIIVKNNRKFTAYSDTLIQRTSEFKFNDLLLLLEKACVACLIHFYSIIF